MYNFNTNRLCILLLLLLESNVKVSNRILARTEKESVKSYCHFIQNCTNSASIISPIDGVDEVFLLFHKFEQKTI